MKESIYHPMTTRSSGKRSNEIIQREKNLTKLSEEGVLLGLWNSLAKLHQHLALKKFDSIRQ